MKEINKLIKELKSVDINVAMNKIFGALKNNEKLISDKAMLDYILQKAKIIKISEEQIAQFYFELWKQIFDEAPTINDEPDQNNLQKK